MTQRVCEGPLIGIHRGGDTFVPAAEGPDDDAHGAEADALFFQAIAESVNLEMEWLWLFTRVAREEERRYCLERALYINPHSDMARHELAWLNGARRPSALGWQAVHTPARLIAVLLLALGVALCVAIAAGVVA
jgi:hypothetical protein